MALLPKIPSDCDWIDVQVFPPSKFISGMVHVAVMQPAKRHRKFVTDLTASSIGTSAQITSTAVQSSSRQIVCSSAWPILALPLNSLLFR